LCMDAQLDQALQQLNYLWGLGYSAIDIVGTVFRVVKTMDIKEAMKLEFIKEIGFTHMRAVKGMNTLLQLKGLIARLCAVRAKTEGGGVTSALT